MARKKKSNPQEPGAAPKRSSRSYPQLDLKLLWGLAAARCAFDGTCRRLLVAQATEHDPAAVIGDIAHIVPSSDEGPRADPNFPVERRDRYENLLLLCGPHHDTVDKQPNSYTIADLRAWKRDHEAWVQERLAEAIPAVSFAELEIVANALLAGTPLPPTTDFSVTPPREKMEKNDLSERVHFLLSMGLSKASEVRQFVTATAQLYPDWPERLRARFVEEYDSLREEGTSGDDLFHALLDFAGRRTGDFQQRAAGLAVLCYLFESCEVFER